MFPILCYQASRADTLARVDTNSRVLVDTNNKVPVDTSSRVPADTASSSSRTADSNFLPTLS